MQLAASRLVRLVHVVVAVDVLRACREQGATNQSERGPNSRGQAQSPRRAPCARGGSASMPPLRPSRWATASKVLRVERRAFFTAGGVKRRRSQPARERGARPRACTSATSSSPAAGKWGEERVSGCGAVRCGAVRLRLRCGCGAGS